MTEPAAQPSPDRPPRRSPPKRGTCRIDGATDVIIAADGMCWAHYARSRRPTRPTVHDDTPEAILGRRHHLAAIKAARRRVTNALARAQTSRRTLRTRVRLAYADGLSFNQLADLTDRTARGAQLLVPASLSRPPGDPTARADEAKLEAWRGPLAEATAAVATADEVVREARKMLRELLVAATDPADSGRVSVEQIAAALGVSFGAVLRWRGGAHPARQHRPKKPTVVPEPPKETP